jgi:hypothetical protein
MVLNPANRLMESATNLVTFNGFLGEYSIALHLAVVVGALIVLSALVVGIVTLRGQGAGLAAACVKDVGLAFLCAILVFTFPGFFYFLGRAFWRAATWEQAVT